MTHFEHYKKTHNRAILALSKTQDILIIITQYIDNKHYENMNESIINLAFHKLHNSQLKLNRKVIRL